MTAEQLEELLSEIDDDSKFRRDTAHDELAVLAPSLARKVIAAEKLVEVLSEVDEEDMSGDLFWALHTYREASK